MNFFITECLYGPIFARDPRDHRKVKDVKEEQATLEKIKVAIHKCSGVYF